MVAWRATPSISTYYSQVTRSAQEGQEGDPVPWILAFTHWCLYDVTARQFGVRDRCHGGYDGRWGTQMTLSRSYLFLGPTSQVPTRLQSGGSVMEGLPDAISGYAVPEGSQLSLQRCVMAPASSFGLYGSALRMPGALAA